MYDPSSAHDDLEKLEAPTVEDAIEEVMDIDPAFRNSTSTACEKLEFIMQCMEKIEKMCQDSVTGELKQRVPERAIATWDMIFLSKSTSTRKSVVSSANNITSNSNHEAATKSHSVQPKTKSVFEDLSSAATLELLLKQENELRLSSAVQAQFGALEEEEKRETGIHTQLVFIDLSPCY